MTPDKLNDIFSAVEQCQKSVKALDRVLATGPASFYLEQLKTYITGCLSFSAFKVGDRVVLSELDRLPSGWAASAHFLIPGAAGIVHEYDYIDTGFIYDIVFDDESWIDRNNIVQPIDQKHSYRLHQRQLMLEVQWKLKCQEN